MEALIAYGVGIVLGLLLSLPILALSITAYVINGLAFTKFSKQKELKYSWLVWIPVANSFGTLYLMDQLSTEREFRLFGDKIVLENKMTSLWICIGIYVGNIILTNVFSLLGMIPIIGILFLILGLLLSALAGTAIAFIEFVYLRDLLFTYKPYDEKNLNTATWVTVANVFTFGLLRAIWIFRIAKENEQPQSEDQKLFDNPDNPVY